MAGGRRGPAPQTAKREQFARLIAQGVSNSGLSEAAYGEYDRQLFIETLFDWGWFGAQGGTPSWLRQWSGES